MCVKKKIEQLEKEIIGMENVMDHVNVLGVSNDLRNKKLELRTILEERAKGALIRARISSIKDIESPTLAHTLPAQGKWNFNIKSDRDEENGNGFLC